MKKYPWELFEDVSEMVYVSDMDTHELIYMNAALRHLIRREDYRGKACHALIQGRDAPCPFCNNHLLREGLVHEWIDHNPVLGRSMLMKETAVKAGGKNYRIQILSDENTAEAQRANRDIISRCDSLVEQCLRRIREEEDGDDSVRSILEFLGNQLNCRRTYVYEISAHQALNCAHEWCAPGVEPTPPQLRGEEIRALDWWLRYFREGDYLQVSGVEDLRTSDPMLYSTVKQQGADFVAVAPLMLKGKLVGFFGLDDPQEELQPYVKNVLLALAQIVVSHMKKRDLIRKLRETEDYDLTTGAWSRQALARHRGEYETCPALGVVCCTRATVRHTMYQQKYAQGDELMHRAFNLIRQIFSEARIYRAADDGLLVIFRERDRTDFDRRIQLLRLLMEGQNITDLFVGAAWSEECPRDVDKLFSEAGKELRWDWQKQEIKRRKVELAARKEESRPVLKLDGNAPGLSEYLAGNYFDIDSLLQSVSMPDLPYFMFFGDLRTNVFYISDSMRDTFGFESNIVRDFYQQWGNRIMDPVDLETYRKDLSSMLAEKRTRHDLRYRILSSEGHKVWVRCSGCMKWNEDRTQPIFFTGIISTQDVDFLVDPVSNYPMEQAALDLLERLRRETPVTVVAFSLNHFSEINRTLGRARADNLLREFSERMSFWFSGGMRIFRLDGLRFMAVLEPTFNMDTEKLVRQLHVLVEGVYRSFGVTIKDPCSVGVLRYPDGDSTPADFINDVVALLSEAKLTPWRPYVSFSDHIRENRRAMAQMELDLNRHVLDGCSGFRVVVQPIVNAKTGRVECGETLLRWRREGRDVSPGVFVPLLEKNKLILLVGKWVFEQAVKVCSRIVTLAPGFRLSFNVNYLQVMDDSFLPFIRETLKRFRVSGEHFIMELTETHYDEAPEKLSNFISACREMGMLIALDDFGSGYSSLSLLMKYPADIVKLDRLMVAEVPQSMEKRKLMETMVYACRQFGKRICAEGVEDAALRDILCQADCDLLQGYYFYRPQELEDLYRILAEQERG